jgi:hypothetical protein
MTYRRASSYTSMALVALLAAAAQAPGVAGFIPNGLSKTRSFVGELFLSFFVTSFFFELVLLGARRIRERGWGLCVA